MKRDEFIEELKNSGFAYIIDLKKYSVDLERTLITTPLIRRNKNGTVVLQESILKSRINKLETLIEKVLTSPTIEEVCVALGEYLGVEVEICGGYYEWLVKRNRD